MRWEEEKKTRGGNENEDGGEEGPRARDYENR